VPGARAPKIGYVRRLVLTLLASALAVVGLPAAESLPVTPGFASPNVEWLANVPLHVDSAGARIHGKYLYASDSRSLTIYDISNPELPVPLGATAVPQVPYFAQEDLETNGKILVLGQGRDTGNPGDLLFVFDVSDKALPTLITTFRGGSSHTLTCVLDCTYLYNSNGKIIDLREPGSPRIAGDWRPKSWQDDGKAAHDLTEITPGLVMASTNPMLYLDARRNPAKPSVIATGKAPDKRFIHGNLWPNRGTDRYLLVGGETRSGNCADAGAGAFMTWDMKDWKTKKTFRMVDEYRPKDSVSPAEGGAPVATYCTHWFTTKPGYRNGGVVAMGWYERGTRFLSVSKTGQIREIGWFLPAGTSSSAAYFVGKDLVYIFDYQRGLDIVRLHDKPVRSPRPVPAGKGLAPTKAPLFARVLRPTFQGVCPAPR
jgi:hypothetical protein